MTGLPKQDSDALTDALAAEHAAVYAYGVVQAYVRARATTELAAQSVAEHRAHRDTAAEKFTRAGAEAPVSAPAYTLPNPVADELSATRLAVRIEIETAQAWRSLVERATLEDLREEGVRALADCAVRAARWRKVLGSEPSVTPLPGTD